MKRLIRQSTVFTSKTDVKNELYKKYCLELKNGKFIRIFCKGPNNRERLKGKQFDVKNYAENITPEIWENEKQKK